MNYEWLFMGTFPLRKEENIIFRKSFENFKFHFEEIAYRTEVSVFNLEIDK
jgi:hypothetical protein